MKKYLLAAVALVVCGTNLEAKAAMEEKQPLFFEHLDWSAEYLTGSKSEFKDPAYKGSKLSYSEAEVSVSYQQPREEDKISQFLDFGYLSANIDWKSNPFFEQKRFNSYKLKYGFSYAFDEHWVWQVGGGADMQVKPFNLKRSTDYGLFVWGRYNYDENKVFNIGVLSWLGIKDKKVYPIIGINYNLDYKWFVNLIFPFKGAVTYMFTDEFGMEVGGRWSQLRRRLKKTEPQSDGIFEYSSQSIELAGFYMFPIGFTLRGFVGTGVGTRMEVYNSDGKNRQLLKMKSPFFGGVSLETAY